MQVGEPTVVSGWTCAFGHARHRRNEAVQPCPGENGLELGSAQSAVAVSTSPGFGCRAAVRQGLLCWRGPVILGTGGDDFDGFLLNPLVYQGVLRS